MGTDANGCWMGNWCQDKSMGGCPPPMGGKQCSLNIAILHHQHHHHHPLCKKNCAGSELNSGEDLCAHITTYSEV